MKILLICITLLSISFNAFSELHEIDSVYFGAVMCPQMKNSQNPIANRHTIYNFYKCHGYSKYDVEISGNKTIRMSNSGFVPLNTYDYFVAYSNSTDEFGNIFSEIQLPKFYDHWKSCPTDLTHNRPSIYNCQSFQVHISCDKYLENLEYHNLITNKRKWRFKRAGYVPLYSYNRKFKGAVSCEDFQRRPTLEKLWADVPNGSYLAEQWEEALEEESECQKRNPTYKDSLECMKSTDAYKALFD